MVLFPQSRNSRNIVFLIVCLLIGVVLLADKSLFAQTLPLENQQQLGQAGELGAANDFHNDVQLGLQNLATNPAAQSLEQEIKNQDYKSTWDEFGTNILIDGAILPAEIEKKINQDIVQSVQIEQNYDQQEAKYLGNVNITPEEIQAMEESGGSDVPPSEPIDPNPSVEANPDVSLFSGEGQPQITPGEATSTENASTAPETTSVVSETSTPPSEATPPSSSDETIFDAILQGELTSPSPTESTPPSSEPPSAESL